MTSESKVAANRRNSRRSSGPRTVQGRIRVSRNALRHGLAASERLAPRLDAELDRLVTAIGGEHCDAAQREQALIIAESELTLLRVRSIRTNIFEQMLIADSGNGVRSGWPPSSAQPIGKSHIEQLRRLERYERRAFSRRQRAIQELANLYY